MSNSLFVDTLGWANIFVPSEKSHTIAAAHFRQAIFTEQPIITTNYVIAELIALLHSPLGITRSKLFQHIDVVRSNPYITRIRIDAELDQTAWNLCKARSDKPWSLVDCTSFVLMKQLKIQTALTTDDLRSVVDHRHFNQAGFIRLLKP